MKKLLLLSLFILSLIISSCTDQRIKKLELENEKLNNRIDTLTTWLAKSRVKNEIYDYAIKSRKTANQIAAGVDDEGFANKAFVISKDFVTKQLKSPGTADFPFSDFVFSQVRDNTITIKSYVDSQNSFGALLRTNYVIQLKLIGGEWNDVNSWQVLSLKFE